MDYNEILKTYKKLQAKQLPLFRVDTREYKPGDIILSQGDYQDKLGEQQLLIEASLSRTQPEYLGFQRKDTIFLFDDIKNALLFWSKNKVEMSNIYKVKVFDDDILYKGDMNYLDFLLEVVRNTKDENVSQVLDSYSKRYWDYGFGCVSPCYELMAKKATVETKVMDGNSADAQRVREDLRKIVYVQLTDKYKELVETYY